MSENADGQSAPVSAAVGARSCPCLHRLFDEGAVHWVIDRGLKCLDGIEIGFAG